MNKTGSIMAAVLTTGLFLASPASTYVTGQNIAVDGGYTCV